MADTAIQNQNTSKLALYRGLIALAWADHELHPDEKSTLHEIIDNHLGLSVEDRAQLHGEVDQPVELSSVWPDISDPQDRARLIDMSNVIFQQDNDFSDAERDLIERFQTKHLASIDIGSVTADLESFSEELARLRKKESDEIKAWASQYGLFGSLKRAIETKLF